MAKQTLVTVTDDIDGSDNAETVEFEAFGVRYSIDLCKKNRTKLEAALTPFIDAATVVKAPRAFRVRAVAKQAVGKDQNAAIRQWAIREGYEVSQRGRIPGEVVEAYHASAGK